MQHERTAAHSNALGRFLLVWWSAYLLDKCDRCIARQVSETAERNRPLAAALTRLQLDVGTASTMGNTIDSRAPSLRIYIYIYIYI